MRSQAIMTTYRHYRHSEPQMIASPERCLKTQSRVSVFSRAAHVEWITEAIQPVLLFSAAVFLIQLCQGDLIFMPFYVLQIPVSIIPNSACRSPPLILFPLLPPPLCLSPSIFLLCCFSSHLPGFLPPLSLCFRPLREGLSDL